MRQPSQLPLLLILNIPSSPFSVQHLSGKSPFFSPSIKKESLAKCVKYTIFCRVRQKITHKRGRSCYREIAFRTSLYNKVYNFYNFLHFFNIMNSDKIDFFYCQVCDNSGSPPYTLFRILLIKNITDKRFS